MSKRIPVPYVVKVPCHCKTGKISSREGVKRDCPYCHGTKYRLEKRPHPSHKMTKFRTEILAPCGTPRFYSVRSCRNCKREEAQAAAGHFLNGLDYPCKAN